MKTRPGLTFLILAIFLTTSSLAFAGTFNLKKIKRWPDQDKVWAIAMDAWMTSEELDVFIKIKDSDERKAFLKDAGYWRIWKEVREEYLESVVAQQVIKGMNQNEVFMAWDKPKKIRKDFRKDAYVNVLNYAFERDKKGREFVMRPDSQTAYKNENFIRFVYMFNGEVFAIVNEGEEEDVMEELPGQDPPEETPPAPTPEASAAEGEDSPQTDAAPDSK